MYIEVYISVLKGYKFGQNKASIIFPSSCAFVCYLEDLQSSMYKSIILKEHQLGSWRASAAKEAQGQGSESSCHQIGKFFL